MTYPHLPANPHLSLVLPWWWQKQQRPAWRRSEHPVWTSPAWAHNPKNTYTIVVSIHTVHAHQRYLLDFSSFFAAFTAGSFCRLKNCHNNIFLIIKKKSETEWQKYPNCRWTRSQSKHHTVQRKTNTCDSSVIHLSVKLLPFFQFAIALWRWGVFTAGQRQRFVCRKIGGVGPVGVILDTAAL